MPRFVPRLWIQVDNFDLGFTHFQSVTGSMTLILNQLLHPLAPRARSLTEALCAKGINELEFNGGPNEPSETTDMGNRHQRILSVADVFPEMPDAHELLQLLAWYTQYRGWLDSGRGLFCLDCGNSVASGDVLCSDGHCLSHRRLFLCTGERPRPRAVHRVGTL